MPKFHCKVSIQLKQELIKKAREQKMSVSKFVRNIFKEAGDYLDRVVCTSSSYGSTYLRCDGTEELYVNLSLEDYFVMKHLHYAINIFSMGQILRTLLEKYMKLRNRYGRGKLENLLGRFKRKWLARRRRVGGVFDKAHMCSLKPRCVTHLSEMYKVILVKLIE